ncbi:MAG: aldehyde dehydrogenase family protein, partial [Candidatus Saccharimonadales bacterium]
MSDTIDQLLAELAAAKTRWRRTSLSRRIELAAACVEGVFRSADAWLAASCEAKGLALDSPRSSEELATGPLAVTRYLQLLITSLRQLERTGRVRLLDPIEVDARGRLRLPLFPARGLFDSLLFPGYRAWAMLPGDVTRDNLAEHVAGCFRRSLDREAIAVVLGAGNVSSIPIVDALSKLFQENRVVLVKLNPVNGYLAPIFEEALAPLIEAGFLRLLEGGAEAGAYAVHHPQVSEVHITGSLAAHQAIVWGPPGDESDQRRRSGAPLLTKPITSE